MRSKENNAGNQTVVTLNMKLLALQKKIVKWLNEKCSRLSGKTLMAMLIVFCSASATLLIMLILGKL